MGAKTIGEDFAEEVKINRHLLQEESEIQPSLYFHYSDLLADAKSDKDKASNTFDYVKAEVELALRSDPPEGIKVTEGSIKSLVSCDEKVKKYEERLQKANSVVYKLEAAVRALDHRKSELNNLTQLWIKNYYSQPDDGRPKESGNDSYSKDTRKNLRRKKDGQKED